MLTGRPADNINETITVGELITKLVTYPPDIKVEIRVVQMGIKGAEEFLGGDDSVTIVIPEPLTCALELEDIHYDYGRVMLVTGHNALDNLLEQF